MQIMQINSILAITFFAAFIFKVDGLKCYTCNSYNNTLCDDITINSNASRKYLQECAATYQGNKPFCRKTKIIIIGKPKVFRISRSCGWIKDEHAQPCYKYENDFHIETICACHEEGCNSAPSPSQNTLKLATLFSFILIIFLS